MRADASHLLARLTGFPSLARHPRCGRPSGADLPAWEGYSKPAVTGSPSRDHSALHSLDGGRDLCGSSNVAYVGLDPEAAGSSLDPIHFQRDVAATAITHNRQPPQPGDKLAQLVEPLGSKIGLPIRHACDI